MSLRKPILLLALIAISTLAARAATGSSVAAGPPTPQAGGATGGARQERVTVECFSIPTGAEILIDGDFYGHTPSILKLTPATHRLEFQMPGYRPYSQTLRLAPGSGITTIRATLEKRE
jgi:hypothetical protein